VKKAYFFLIWTRVRISPDPPEGAILNFKFVPFFICSKTLININFQLFLFIKSRNNLKIELLI